MAHSQNCRELRITNDAAVVAKFKADGPNGRIATSGNMIMGETWKFNMRDHGCSRQLITISADVKGGKNPATFQVNYNGFETMTYFVRLSGTIFKTTFDSIEVL